MKSSLKVFKSFEVIKFLNEILHYKKVLNTLIKYFFLANSPGLFAVYIDAICKLSNVILGTTVYADDMLLTAPCVSIVKVTTSL